MSGLFVFRGGPFGGLPLPRGSVVVSDEQLLERALAYGFVGDAIKTAPFLCVELGRLQAKNEIAPGVLLEVLLARLCSWEQRPVALLMHDAGRYGWSASKSAEVEAFVRSRNPVIDWYRGGSHIVHSTLDSFASIQWIDDGSVPDVEDLTIQADYR